MSIQSSINQALGTVELTLLRTGTVTTPLRKYPVDPVKEAEKKQKQEEKAKREAERAKRAAEKQAKGQAAPDASESPTTQETAPATETAAPTPEMQPAAAQPATPGDIMISGDQMAAQMAAGRVQAKTEQIKKGKLGRQERLDMLRAKRKDVRKLEQEIHELEDTFKKKSRGGAK